MVTGRKQEILLLLAKGYSKRECAAILNISEHTVKTHVEKMLSRIGTTTTIEAVVLGIAQGWIPSAREIAEICD